ncbi:unnamed protein product [Symbiodinium sp. CCMP2456]|nr:unnamed protein product [Symbiodinium sp. CCMP2456]
MSSLPEQGRCAHSTTCSHAVSISRRRTSWPTRPKCHFRGVVVPSSLRRQQEASGPWLLLRGIISEEERLNLLESAERQKRQGLLLPNPAGPHRFFRRLDATGGVDSFLEELTERLEDAVAGLHGRQLDPTLGRVCSYIETGGFIHEHRDRYHAQTDGLAHLRANIVVQMEPSGRPIIAGKSVPVSERDAWIFFASRELHSTEVICGPHPRIVYGFGWSVPASFTPRTRDRCEFERKKKTRTRTAARQSSTPRLYAVEDVAMMPTGLKGKLASLEDFISMQNEELAAQRQEIESLRNDKTGIEDHYQAQLQELKKTMVGDVQRLQDEVKRHFAQQKAENARLQQQITTLKGEKTSLQQQILGLQRRIQEIEEQVLGVHRARVSRSWLTKGAFKNTVAHCYCCIPDLRVQVQTRILLLAEWYCWNQEKASPFWGDIAVMRALHLCMGFCAFAVGINWL